MMVIFVSECEKRALKKTRRVLDAFASRIGSNTWQTVITQEGLLTVKKMLRKTASKSTAVSCHWVRSRARSDFLWVVGNKNKFNYEGIVAVNYTTKELIMDKLPTDTANMLANTQGQPLAQHLFAVGYIAYQLIDRLHIGSAKLKQSAFIAGVCHDLGKIDPEFQRWIKKKQGKIEDEMFKEDGIHIDSPKKFSFELHPRHHEISWLLAVSLLNVNELNNAQKDQIAHGIYWHHTKPYRKDDKFIKAEAIYSIFNKSLNKEKFAGIYETAIAVINDVNTLSEAFGAEQKMPALNSQFTLTHNPLPVYKKYDDWLDEVDEFKANVKVNALNNLVRTAVISADRIVSSCSSEDLEEYLSEGTLLELVDRELSVESSTLEQSINTCLIGFEEKYPSSEQNQSQRVAAKSLADLQKISEINGYPDANVVVLQGPAGCGKTKIALEWAKNTNVKKLIWVCPRVQICLGLFHDLTSGDYLPNSRVEIFTGEYKKISKQNIPLEELPDTEESDFFSGDIIITTIDQVINAVTTHHKVTTMIDLLNAHVVFDEFHELINMSAFNLLFAELIEVKKLQGSQANTLLVSATPHYYFIKSFLGIPDADIISIKSFNRSSYKISFEVYDDEDISPLLLNPQNGKTFVITNTAIDAQLGFLHHQESENSVLLHSKYTQKDKARWFNEVFACFKRGGNGKFDVLRSGPIIQASLNISCDRMMTELTCAENWLQRLGRLDRFGQNSEINPYITVMPKSIAIEGKQKSRCARFLNQLFTWQSTKAWLAFLQAAIEDNSIVTINQLYKIYQDFYDDKSVEKWIEQDFLMALKKSVILINHKIIDPISVPPKSKHKNSSVKISTNSLRGDNRFVQMAVCEVDANTHINFIDEYAISGSAELTESIEAMRGYGEDDNNLVQFMQKKHHNIKQNEGYKKVKKEWDLIKQARSPELPIYLSYTPVDLEAVGGMSVAHPQAMYYIKSKKQPVGTMSIRHLKTSKKGQ